MGKLIAVWLSTEPKSEWESSLYGQKTANSDISILRGGAGLVMVEGEGLRQLAVGGSGWLLITGAGMNACMHCTRTRFG